MLNNALLLIKHLFQPLNLGVFELIYNVRNCGKALVHSFLAVADESPKICYQGDFFFRPQLVEPF